MAGFAAACYQRGVAYVQVPTTLLAQVDSSVGGKTGVNHPGGKNLIGAFHQPRAVIADTSTLRTLPEREMQRGARRSHQVRPASATRDVLRLARAAQLDALLGASTCAALDTRDRPVVRESRREIVGADEREHGQRALLNLGHTFGHAIETATGYGEWLHGEAVGAGMLLAAELSARIGWLARADVERVRALLAARGAAGARAPRRSARAASSWAWTRRCWPAASRLVLLRGIGEAVVTGDYPDDALQATLRAAFEAVNMTDDGLAPYAATTSASRGRRYPEAAAAAPHRVPARPRPDRALDRVPTPGLQDAGVRQSRRRPVSHAAHAFLEVAQIAPQRRARAGAQRAADRSDLPRARSRPHAVRPRGPGRAQRVHARTRRLRAQPAVAARRRRARGALRGVSRAQSHLRDREGILKHCSARNARRLGELGERFLERRQPGLEAQIANLADEIAYNNHDVDDGLRAGLIDIDEPAQGAAMFRRQLDVVIARYPDLGRAPARARSHAAHDRLRRQRPDRHDARSRCVDAEPASARRRARAPRAAARASASRARRAPRAEALSCASTFTGTTGCCA